MYSNINFSRKTVRNNHAITETLTLFLCGLLYPFFPQSKIWKERGKKWFEEEINYQIYQDGSFLQFSMNYHRVVIQLLTWAVLLAKNNKESFLGFVYKKSELSLNFLLNHINQIDGFLPNYGPNDGALFFKLNNCDYRDYRPQLNALEFVLEDKIYFDDKELLEDSFWYGLKLPKMPTFFEEKNLASFKEGGYYTIRDEQSFTFIRCGKYKDRPAQSDNLHIDIWVKGENILRDAGSYLYNSSEEDIMFFNGTKGHNLVMLNGYDQMLKGARFIWYYWTQAESACLSETVDYFKFEGKIKAFTYVKNNIYIVREVIKDKSKNIWEICDNVINNPGLEMIQIWNPSDSFFDKFTIKSVDEKNNIIGPEIKHGWFSGYYGVKEKTKQIIFKSTGNKIKTIIEEN